MNDVEDTFEDLAALAANGDGDGALTFWPDGSLWSYAGAKPDRSGTNLRLPVESVSDARVKAAVAAGVWAVRFQDAAGRPMTVLRADDHDGITRDASSIGTSAMGTVA